MVRLYRAFREDVQVVLLLLAGGAVFITATAAGVWVAEQAHTASRARQLVCAAELDALRARNPFVERYVRPADACLALEVARR